MTLIAFDPQKVMEEVDADKDVDIQMLNIPLDMDIPMNEQLNHNDSLKYTLDFAIR